jgi:putative peptidoglycan lipid II flippase
MLYYTEKLRISMSHIARSTLIIAVFFGLEKVLGFARQVLISRTFGRSAELDAFNAANNIPDMLFALISGGALAMALIPVLSEYLETKSRPQAWDVFSRIANLVFLSTSSMSILVAIFANQLVSWNIGIAPGFGPEQQVLVADLMRLNLISTLLFSMAGLIIAGLQANQHFLLPAIAPSMYDVGTLVGILILVPEEGFQLGPIVLPALGLGIKGLVYGTILGAGLFFTIQIPGLVKFKFKWSPKINLYHQGVRQVLSVLGPRVLTMFFIQSIFIAQDNLASRLVEGSVTALVYGWLFMQVPESLIGTAIGTALLPTISEQVARNEHKVFQASLTKTIRVILAFTIPSAALLIAGIRPLVLILGFDTIGTELIVWITRAYTLGLVSFSLIEVTSRAFYAQQNARTPLFTITITAGTFIILAIPLARWIGAPGIALANSIAFSLQLMLMLWLLNKKYKGFFQTRNTLFRVIPISVIGAFVVSLLINVFPLETTGTLISTLLTLGALMVGGLLVLPFIWPEIKLLVKFEEM